MAHFLRSVTPKEFAQLSDYASHFTGGKVQSLKCLFSHRKLCEGRGYTLFSAAATVYSILKALRLVKLLLAWTLMFIASTTMYQQHLLCAAPCPYTVYLRGFETGGGSWRSWNLCG